MSIDHKLESVLEAIPFLSAIEQEYSYPTRHYHTFGHAIEVLGWVETAAAFPNVSLSPYSWNELRLAALFHDVVYTAEGTPANERRSCGVMSEMLAAVASSDSVERIAELIIFTANHGKLKTGDLPEAGRLLLDADIANMAEPNWHVFLQNNENIVRELREKYTEGQIVTGRRAFLEGLLDNESLYLSEFFRTRLEARARANLRRLLDEVV